VEHEGRNCAIPGRFKIFPLLRLNFSLRENSKHITSVDIAIAERGNRSGYPERSGMDKTTLNFVDWRGDMIYATNVSKVTIRDIHLTRDTPGATQGVVTKVSKGQVVLKIPEGFPTPDGVHNGHEMESNRRYLRKFTNISSPQVVLPDNYQVAWISTFQYKPNTRLWAFNLKYSDQIPNYQVGDLIAVKSKCCYERTSCSYFFKSSREISFERVRWTRQSRGVFRLGTNDVTIKDCQIIREKPINGQGWCLSTSDGGPQFGQPSDFHMHKVKVENFYAENTGDDALAFFNVKTDANVENAKIYDSFARSILLHESPDVKFSNVQLERSPACVNDDIGDVKKIYGDFENSVDPRTFDFLWNLIVPPSTSVRPINPPSNDNKYVNYNLKYNYDPDGLLGSNCTLIL